jgi:hypothetical protein
MALAPESKYALHTSTHWLQQRPYNFCSICSMFYVIFNFISTFTSCEVCLLCCVYFCCLWEGVGLFWAICYILFVFMIAAIFVDKIRKYLAALRRTFRTFGGEIKRCSRMICISNHPVLTPNGANMQRHDPGYLPYTPVQGDPTENRQLAFFIVLYETAYKGGTTPTSV